MRQIVVVSIALIFCLFNNCACQQPQRAEEKIIGRWQFHIDSVRLLPVRRDEYPSALRYALKGDFDIIIECNSKKCRFL